MQLQFRSAMKTNPGCLFRQVNNSSEKTFKRLVLRSNDPETPEKSIEAATRRRSLKKLFHKTPVEQHLQTTASKVQKSF